MSNAPVLPPVMRPGTRTYEGAPCVMGHGTTRYSTNGRCIVCAKLLNRDRYYEVKRQRPAVDSRRAVQFRDYMSVGLRGLREAAVNLRGARATAQRGQWVASLRAIGLQPKAVAAIRRWLEQQERAEAQAKHNVAPELPPAAWLEEE